MDALREIERQLYLSFEERTRGADAQGGKARLE